MDLRTILNDTQDIINDFINVYFTGHKCILTYCIFNSLICFVVKFLTEIGKMNLFQLITLKIYLALLPIYSRIFLVICQ